MSAGNGNDFFEIFAEKPQKIVPLDNRFFERSRAGKFGIFIAHRRRVNDDIDARNSLFVRTNVNVKAVFDKSRKCFGIRPVASRNFRPVRLRPPYERAHRRAPDAYKMHFFSA